MKTTETTVLIVLKVECVDPSDVFDAVDRYLDFGRLQDAINDEREGILVLSALSTTGHQYLANGGTKL